MRPAGVQRGTDSLLGSPPSRWVVLALLALAPVGSYYALDLPAALNRPLAAAFAAPAAAWQQSLAALYASYALPNVIAPFIATYLIDALGPRSAMAALSVVAASAATTFAVAVSTACVPLALAARFVLGAAADSIHVAQSRIASNWFDGPELALALCTIISISRLGSVLNDVLSPIIAAFPNPGYIRSHNEERIGTAAACWASAFLCVISAFAAFIVVHIDHRHEKRSFLTAAPDTRHMDPETLHPNNPQFHPHDNTQSAHDSSDALIGNTIRADPVNAHDDATGHVWQLYRHHASRDFIGHRTSTQNLRSSRLFGYRMSASSIQQPPSLASSSSSDVIQQQTLVRKWWTPSTDNLDALQSIPISQIPGSHPSGHESSASNIHRKSSKNNGIISVTPSLLDASQPQHSIPTSSNLPPTTQSNHPHPIMNDVLRSSKYNASLDADSLSIHSAESHVPPAPPATIAASTVSDHIDILPARPSHQNTGFAASPTRVDQASSPEKSPSPENNASNKQKCPSISSLCTGTKTIWAHVCIFPIEFWLIILLMALYYGCTTPFIIILSDDLQNSSFLMGDAQRAGWLLALPDLVSTLMVPACGSIIDNRGRRIIILAICGFSLAIVHAIFAIPDIRSDISRYFLGYARIAALFLLGTAYAFYICVFWPLIALIVPDDAQPTAYAVATSSLNLGMVIIPFLVAQTIVVGTGVNDMYADYTYVHYLFGCMGLFGAVVVCPILFFVDHVKNDGMMNMRGLVMGPGGVADRPDVAYGEISDDGMDCLSQQRHGSQISDEHVSRSIHADVVGGTNPTHDVPIGAITGVTNAWIHEMALAQPSSTAETPTIITRASGTVRWVVHGTMYGAVVDEDTCSSVATQDHSDNAIHLGSVIEQTCLQQDNK